MTWRAAAGEVDVPERTLRDWRRRPPEVLRRGRPVLGVPLALRNEIIRFLHQVSGPNVGMPALRALFPTVPRSVLEDLLRRYRRVWRRRYRRTGFRLEWHQPGRVWAMDHSRASQLIDGQYRQIFAVRDLASREQLAWQPVRSTGLDEVLPILQALFESHGRPLVLKSDNGSAFRAEATSEWLLADSVVQLFSPAGYPQYNGQLERSNAVNKTYTHHRAVAEGHPHRWTADDLDYARGLTNTISRPWGHTQPTPDEAWQARMAISDEERNRFAAELAAQRARLVAQRDWSTEPTAEEEDDLQRCVIAAALEACGYLTKQEVRRAPRARKRQRRESLERSLRQFRQQGGATKDAEMFQDTIAALRLSNVAAATPISTPTAPSAVAAPDSAFAFLAGALPHAEPKPQALLLDRPAPDDTMQTALVPSDSSLDTGPPDAIAHRERPTSIWWRRPITLLLTLAKAAKISH
jgi:transposase InsO family protein